MREILLEGLERLGIPCTQERAETLCKYAQLLLERNRVMNLTAITDPLQVARLHFLDSAALFLAGPLAGKRLLDVGAGAGFPGMVVKLLEPRVSLTALDSLKKRMDFLEEAARALGVEDARFVHGRAEELGRLPGWREEFDAVTARAVADLRVLCELCLPFVRVGGVFLAMKGRDSEEELEAALPALETLGGSVERKLDYALPGTDVTHRLLLIRKTAPTPDRYPRRFAKIQKSPL